MEDFFNCIEDVPLPDTNLVVVTDSCGPIITTVQADTTGSGCKLDTMTITRRYIFTDGSNLDTCIQIFKVADDQPPVILCPAPVTVQCATHVPAPDASLVSATNNCPGNTISTFVGSVTSGQTCANRFIVTRTYRVQDQCGNSATCTQTITVFDNTPPNLSCPANVTVQCASQVPTPNVASVTSTENCADGATITHVGDAITNQTCANRFTLTRTYRATDACGNSATCNQVITVFDNTQPGLTCPSNVTVQCANLVPAPNPALVTSTDNCGGIATITHVGDAISNQTCVSRFSITRTYRSTDECGNSATCVQTIIVFDNTAPGLTCPVNITVQCANQVPAPNPALVTSTDNCGGTATVTHVGDVISNQTCVNRFNITRTYRSTDECGNSATCTQTITIFDNTAPGITCPANVTVQCANLVPAPIPALVSSTDNCGGIATVTHIGDVISGQTCVNRFNITRTYRTTDECGNSATCTQTITVFDNTAPSINMSG
jgi:ribosomal protein S26